MEFGAVNFLAVLVGAVINMVLGALWYGPLFGNLWLKLIGKNKQEIKGSPWLYLFSFIAAFVAAVVLALAVLAFSSAGFFGGMLAGGVVWLGFVATTSFTFSIFEGPKLSVWLLFAAYQLVVFAIEGGIFAVW